MEWNGMGCDGMEWNGMAKVSDSFLFVSGEDAAKQQGLVNSKGITHIINCAGPQCPNYLEYVR